MKPFELQSILNFRRILEDRAKQKLFQVKEKVAYIEEEKDHQENLIQQLSKELELKKQQGISAQEIIFYQNHIKIKQNQIGQLELDLKEAHQEVLEKEKALLEASRDKKLFEKLKETQNERYEQHLQCEETKELDELAVLFYKRSIS